MIPYIRFAFLLFFLVGCQAKKLSQRPQAYSSETLAIQPISDHVYQHISYLESETYGHVPCNGMIVFDKNEAIIFDTAADTTVSAELINWVQNELHCTIKAVVPTHFHTDCVGGLEAFHRRNIPSYANNPTIRSATASGFPVPQNGFDKVMEFTVGNKKVLAEFMGEGHTRDNVVGYFPEDKVMFGGCLIKEVGAAQGNLADANIEQWPATVSAIKTKYPDIKMVIPGHGKPGGTELFEYTMQLFRQK